VEIYPGDIMLDIDTIRTAVSRLVEAASAPSRVILFGSYARESAEEGSDLDLLVIQQNIEDRGREYLRLREALGRVSPGIGVDLLLYQESDYVRRSQVPGTLLFEARQEGKILYDALH
jgi:predicted nucleotidyltransferase